MVLAAACSILIGIAVAAAERGRRQRRRADDEHWVGLTRLERRNFIERRRGRREVGAQQKEIQKEMQNQN